MELTVCRSDAELEAWRSVRMAVLPYERCPTLADLRAADAPDRLLLLATTDGRVVGSGQAGRSNSAGVGYVAPRVLPEHRRNGVGSRLLEALAEHCGALGLLAVRATIDDEGSVRFAERFGFVEVDRQVEQVRAVGDEPEPSGLPDGVEVVLLSDHPELWASCYATFGREVLADFAVYVPLEVSEERWIAEWSAEPMFLAVHEGSVIGCAGLHLDTDAPERAEHALTAVTRGWRGRGLAVHLKRRTLHWAAGHGIREVYTWTQAGNRPMITLNERLGYAPGLTSVTASRALPMDFSS